MMLPTKEECFKIWDEYKLPENIRQHTFLVTKISMLIGKKLKQKGRDINLDLLEDAALLHDLDKKECCGNVKLHGSITYDIIIKKGYSKELAEMIKVHSAEFNHGKKARIELEILRYADSRSLGDKIVSIKERFEDLKRRYEHMKTGEYDFLKDITKELEDKLFSELDFKPEDLEKEIKNEC